MAVLRHQLKIKHSVHTNPTTKPPTTTYYLGQEQLQRARCHALPLAAPGIASGLGPARGRGRGGLAGGGGGDGRGGERLEVDEESGRAGGVTCGVLGG
jgi:hypothetical protein